MKMLLIADNQDIKELLTFQITSRFQITVQECASSREAVEALKDEKSKFELIVAPYNGPDSVLVKCLRQQKAQIPVLFFYDPLVGKPDAESMKGLNVAGTVENEKLVNGLLNTIENFFKVKKLVVGPDGLSEYCPIRTNLLIRVSPLKSPIYIRLSETKFVKLFRVGDEFTTADLEKYYQEKKVEYMYLQRSETAEFIKRFRTELEVLLSRDDLHKKEGIQASEMAQEAIHELVHSIGFTDDVQDLAKKNIELVLKTIGANPKLSELIDKITHEGSYISQHSTLLAHVSCCVAKEMRWGSEATFSKLVIAAYVHDLSLKNPEIAKVNNLRELEETKASFPPEEVKEYHLHPAKSADMVRSFSEVPADVDIIVQQHHERANGSGFPRGLLFNYIAPLSSLFIVAHELTQEILEKRAHFSLPKFVVEKKANFSHGNFKKVMAALEKVKM